MGDTLPQEAVAVVREFYEKLLGEGTLPQALGLLHDDFVLHSPPGLPYGGEYHGPNGLMELRTRLRGMVSPGLIGELEFLDAGDRVVVHATGRFTSVASGQSAIMDVAELFTVRNGQIIDMDIYYKDPAAVAALVAQ